MALPYGDVKDLYDTLLSSGVTTQTLPEWAAEMNQQTGSNLFDQGLHDNILKRGSHALDKLIEATGLPAATEGFGRSVGEAVGAPEEGARIGHGLGRTVVNFAPLLIPGVGWGATAARLGLTGLLSGAESYEQTGSPAAGLISGATAAALPKVADVAEQYALRKLGGRLVEGPIADAAGNVTENIRRFFPETTGQRVGAFLTGQGVAAGTMSLSDASQRLLEGESPESPFTKANALNLTLGQLPFFAISLLTHGRGGKPADRLQEAIDLSRKSIETRQAADAAKDVPPISTIPDNVQDEKPPEAILQETETRLAQLRGEQVKVQDDPDLTPAQRVDKINGLLQEESDLLRKKNVVTGTSVFGDSITPQVERTEVLGKQVAQNKAGTWRAILVSDDESNPPELRGKVVGYSTAYEPNPTFGVQSQETGLARYSLPGEQWRTIKSSEEWFKRQPQGQQQPELPQQPTIPTKEQLFGHVEDLKLAKAQVDNAQSLAELQQAVTNLNDVRAQIGLAPSNDATIKRKMAMFEKSELVDEAELAKVAVKSEINDTQRQLERSVAPLTPQEAATVSARFGAEDTEGNKGFSVVTADKLSHAKSDDIETKPLADVVTDFATVAIRSKEGADALRSAGEEGGKDVQDFVDLIEHFGGLKFDNNVAAKFLNDRLGTVGWDAKEVQAFLDKPWVKTWDRLLQSGLQRFVAKSPVPISTKHVAAGGNFFFGLRPIEAVKGLGKEGTMSLGRFRNSVSDEGAMSSGEIDLLKQLVPEAFKGDTVNVRELYRLLPERGPTVETKTLGEGTSDSRRLLEIVHELDTKAPGWFTLSREQRANTWPELRHLFDESYTIKERAGGDAENLREEGSRYSFLAPKPESEMKGYVEGLVKTPAKPITLEEYRKKYPSHYGNEASVRADWLAAREAGETSPNTYRGPHFGSEDTNVLAFYRGYEETLPNGEKAFHIIEVQSDWAQSTRDRLARREGLPPNERALLKEPADHPLLKVYEGLALKAAVAHAKEIGATKVILSDAETAMMTEGHDRAASYKIEDKNGKHVAYATTAQDAEVVVGHYPGGKVIRQTQQDAGMRLHYDQTLPSAMEKLTGDAGAPVELGMHKAVVSLDRIHDMQQQDVALRGGEPEPNKYNVEGSPVFRDVSGNPKTQITGRVYDISHLPQEFTLFNPRRTLGRVQGEQPFEPTSDLDQSVIKEMGIGQGATAHLDFLKASGDPLLVRLANFLGTFTEAGQRISSRVVKMDGVSYALRGSNRDVNIVFNHGLLRADPIERAYVVAHELIHGYTMTELDNPAKQSIVNELTALREDIVKKLPKDMREAYQKAVDEKFMEKYHADLVEHDALHPDQEKAHILYGLLDNDEFLAQGFTSPPFINYIRGLKESFPQRVAGWVKKVLGLGTDIKDTVFEKFLFQSTRLLQQGNYAAGLQNYGENFYRNLGFSDVLARDYTQRGVGLVNGISFGAEKADLLQQLEIPTQIHSADFLKANRDVIKMTQEKGDDFQLHSQVMDELGFRPNQFGITDLAHAILNGEVPDASAAVELLPTATTDLLFAKAKEYKAVLTMLKAAASEKNEGLVNLWQPKTMRPLLTDTLKSLDKLLAMRKVIDEGAQMVREMQAVAPDGFLNRYVDDVRKAPAWFGKSALESDVDKVGWFKRFLGTAAQVARSNPVTAEYFDAGYNLSANARRMHENIIRVMAIDPSAGDGKINSNELNRAIKAVDSPKLLRAVDLYMHANNRVAHDEGRGVTLLPPTHPKVTEILKNLSPEERDNVLNVVVKAGIMTQKGQQEELNMMSKVAVTRGAVLAMKDKNLNTQQAVSVAKTLWDAATADRTNPQAVQLSDAQIREVQSKLTPEGFLALLKFTQNEMAKVKEYRDFYSQNPNWATARRMEPWLIEYKRGKKLVQDQGSSRKEVLAKAEGATITKAPWNQYADAPDSYVPPSLSEEAFHRLAQLEQNQADILKSRGIEDDVIAQMKQWSPVTQYAREQAANVGSIPNFRTPPRLLSKGADELPWLWNHISYMERLSNYWTRQLFRAQSDLHIADPEIQSRPDILKLIQTHRDGFLATDPEIVRKVTKFSTAWFMGFNPASAMINGFQTLTTLVPELTNITGKPIDSYRRLVSAIHETMQHGGTRSWGDEEMTRFMKTATDAGERDFSMWDEDAATQAAISTRWKQMMSKHKVQTMGQQLGTAAGNYTNVGLWLFKQVEKFNHDVALVSAFRLAREQGLNFDEASQQAFQVNRAVNYGGGKVNRPIGVFSGEGAFPRSLALLGSNMQGYNIGVISQLSRYIQQGFFRPTGLKPSEIHAARVAATQMLATQFLLAGTLGLPFVAGVMGVLDKAFPNLEVNRHVREWANSLLGGDGDGEHILSDIALTGVPSMFGWDMQSRLSMGNLVPGVTEYNGFDPQQLLGPPVSLVSNFVSGAGHLAQGNPQGALSFVPPGLRKFTDLLTSSGKLHDYAGRPVFDPSVGEQVGVALGFQPKRLSDFNAASRIAKQTEDVSRLRTGQFHQTLAEDILKGNFGSVRQALLSKAQADTNYDPVSGARAVAKAAEDLTFPRDLRREGSTSTSAVRSRLLGALNIPATNVSEVDRLNFRSGVERRLGVPSAQPSAQEQQIASLMDALRRRDPLATRVELRSQAEKLVRRSRLSTLLPDLTLQ